MIAQRGGMRGAPRGRGGFGAGGGRDIPLSELEPRDINMVKSKLRGAKVRYYCALCGRPQADQSSSR
jgi:hypothetical protein